MTYIRTMMLVALCVSIVGSRDVVKAQAPQQLNPKAAQQFATDSEKAASGDPEAAYRVGEELESGRLGGVKDVKKALSYYRFAALKGSQQDDEKVWLIKGEL